ncbi:hypothetical protein K439DRAFT_1654413 [Ramaria rubella]|nr:hypothetical protein K439DRAFT_1654413 [Ramaria rubella]
MSQVLVPPPPMPISLMDAVNCSPPQQQLYLNGTNLQDVPATEERILASQLAYLASQHHASEYNRLKFGSSGSPVMYTPLSIQVPAHVRDLKARQIRHAPKQVWWPADAPEKHGEFESSSPLREEVQTRTSEPSHYEHVGLNSRVAYSTIKDPEFPDLAAHTKPAPTLNHPPAVNLQRELSVAMSSPLSIITIPQLCSRDAFPQPNLSLHAKTSVSHPINISPIVPFELLPLITSHLAQSSPEAPHMFDLPPSLLLHHLVAHSPSTPSDMVRSYPLMRVPNGNLPFSVNGAGPPALNHLPLEPCGMPDPITEIIPMQNRHAQISSNCLHTYDASESAMELPSWKPDLPRHPGALSYTPLSPPSVQGRPHSAPPLLSPSLASQENQPNGIATSPPSLSEVVHAMSSDILANVDNAEKALISHPAINDTSPTAPWALSAAPHLVPPLRPALGNILLSSCPGKKVRLTGPVKGRSAICRDLTHDLRRVKALGIGCIICCLDDDELEFLGASWSQYSQIARGVGLDILRIPMPEGLTPTSPATLDQHLSYIINSYTLQGVPVLVHCRGGVGRAGLVACCWMMKLGLCGWVTPATSMEDKETVELVERAITVVRRRRSVKAIETYEQVHFLVEFVEHLKLAGIKPNL